MKQENQNPIQSSLNKSPHGKPRAVDPSNQRKGWLSPQEEAELFAEILKKLA